jgi:hypothetical protein
MMDFDNTLEEPGTKEKENERSKTRSDGSHKEYK